MAAVACVGLAPASARGQSLFERLNLDRLRLTALGISSGPVDPARTEPTQAYSIFADYGEIARHWRVVFTVTFWGSHFDREVVAEFATRLGEAIIDPSGDDTLDLGRVRVSDIALEMDFRYTPLRSAFFRPYAGAGVGTHAINAEAPFIRDTFVESALDNIATGIAAVAGIDTAPVGRLGFGAQARYNFLSNVRFWSLRVSGSYHFGAPRPSSLPP